MNLSCALCGISGPQVRPFLVEWAEPIGSKRFDSLPRCTDVAECKQRVEQQGESWPLVESKEGAGAA